MAGEDGPLRASLAAEGRARVVPGPMVMKREQAACDRRSHFVVAFRHNTDGRTIRNVTTRDGSSIVPDEANQSYRDVLRNRHVAGLLLGDLLANAGTGMIIVAMPVQTLSIHGGVPKAVAIGLVEAAPFVLSTILALAIGLGRISLPPRSLLITDCVLRSLTFATLGILALTDQLTLPILIAGLLFGATFRLAGSSSRRLLATSMSGDTGRFAVNGLLGLNATFALYIVGPVLGGVIVAFTSAGVALFFDAFGASILLAAVLMSVPEPPKTLTRFVVHTVTNRGGGSCAVGQLPRGC